MKIVRIRLFWQLLLAVALMSSMVIAPRIVVHAQDNPMAAPTFEVEDDEPEGARPQPTIPPSPTSAERFMPVIAPLPPQRPWARPASPAPEPARGTTADGEPESALAPAPDAAPPAVKASPVQAPKSEPTPAGVGIPVDAPLPPRRPGSPAPLTAEEPAAAPVETLQIPAIAGPERDVPFSIEPDMRVAFAPTIAIPSTTAEIEAEEARTPEPTIVEKQTDAVDIACIKPEVMELVRAAGEKFGSTPVITSGQRNRGRSGSFHRKCMAADFFVPGVERARLAQFLRSLPGAGGVGTYCHTKSVHIDIGDPRNWSQCGRRFRFAQR